MDRERRAITYAFQRLISSQSLELDQLRKDLRQRNADAAATAALVEQLQQELGRSEQQREALRLALDEERGTVMAALRELQRLTAAHAAEQAEQAGQGAAAATPELEQDPDDARRYVDELPPAGRGPHGFKVERALLTTRPRACRRDSLEADAQSEEGKLTRHGRRCMVAWPGCCGPGL